MGLLSLTPPTLGACVRGGKRSRVHPCHQILHRPAPPCPLFTPSPRSMCSSHSSPPLPAHWRQQAVSSAPAYALPGHQSTHLPAEHHFHQQHHTTSGRGRVPPAAEADGIQFRVPRKRPHSCPFAPPASIPLPPLVPGMSSIPLPPLVPGRLRECQGRVCSCG